VNEDRWKKNFILARDASLRQASKSLVRCTGTYTRVDSFIVACCSANAGNVIRRAQCTITISCQSGFRLIGNAENANKTNTMYARRRLRNVSTIRPCTRNKSSSLPKDNRCLSSRRASRACRTKERALSNVCLMSRFIHEPLNSRSDELLNWTPSH